MAMFGMNGIFPDTTSITFPFDELAGASGTNSFGLDTCVGIRREIHEGILIRRREGTFDATGELEDEPWFHCRLTRITNDLICTTR